MESWASSFLLSCDQLPLIPYLLHIALPPNTKLDLLPSFNYHRLSDREINRKPASHSRCVSQREDTAHHFLIQLSLEESGESMNFLLQFLVVGEDQCLVVKRETIPWTCHLIQFCEDGGIRNKAQASLLRANRMRDAPHSLVQECWLHFNQPSAGTPSPTTSDLK